MRELLFKFTLFNEDTNPILYGIEPVKYSPGKNITVTAPLPSHLIPAHVHTVVKGMFLSEQFHPCWPLVLGNVAAANAHIAMSENSQQNDVRGSMERYDVSLYDTLHYVVVVGSGRRCR